MIKSIYLKSDEMKHNVQVFMNTPSLEERDIHAAKQRHH